MIFEEHEKRIFTALNGRQYDPVALNRLITEVTLGQLSLAIDQWQAGLPNPDGSGDIALKRGHKEELEAAKAEAFLVASARKVFELPDFPACLDATALEHLFDFLGWLEKKGQRASDSPAS
jgi:hypothetical protein